MRGSRLCIMLVAVALKCQANGLGQPMSWLVIEQTHLEVGTKVKAVIRGEQVGEGVVVPAPNETGLVGPNNRVIVRVGRLSEDPFSRIELLRAGPKVPSGQLIELDAANGQVVVRSGERWLFVYQAAPILKEGVPADRRRGSYVHPIFGPKGEVLTDDFPPDHYHHRGLFWAWPHVWVEGRHYDLWMLRGITNQFERWLVLQGGSCAVLAVENSWRTEDGPVMLERIWLNVLPEVQDGYWIFFEGFWSPTRLPVRLRGAEEKSYGGLTIRFAPHSDVTITTPLGADRRDLAMTRLAWADFSARFAGLSEASGVSILVDPDHPDFPPEWLTRHYGALCVGWPGVHDAVIDPGQTIVLRYWIWVHRDKVSLEEMRRLYERLSLLKRISTQMQQSSR